MRKNSHSVRDRLRNRLFDSGGFTQVPESIGTNREPRAAASAPQVRKQNGVYELAFAVPGYKPEELSVEIQNRCLTITGTRQRKLLRDGQGLVKYKHDLREFVKTFELEEDMDPKRVTAICDAGILHLRIESKNGRISMAPAPIRVPVSGA